MATPNGEVTLLLQALGAPHRGDAGERLFPLIYRELRQIAGALMHRERPNHTLQATAVVHEAYLRLVVDEHQISWQNRAHFFAIASKVMRRVLLDYARQRRAEKRGGEAARKVDIDAELFV